MENLAQREPGFASIEAVEYRVLGPLAAIGEGEPRTLGGRRQRTVLAVLLANANQVVSQDALIDAVWSGEPPEAAKTTLQSYISNLRRELAGGLVRQGNGYLIAVEGESLDALRFEREVERGRRLLAADPEQAVDCLQKALALWYGLPYGDLGSTPALVPEVARLEELRVTAVEHRIEGDLAIGNHRLVIGELDTLAHEHPYRERLRALHMLALYRSGRQADALRSYQKLRRLLADELGIDPSLELRELEQQILEQDPALDVRKQQPETRVSGESRSLRGYELRDRIGEGDYGFVYRAFQPSVGREVAIKVIRPEYVNQAAFVRRFEAEAQVVAQLEHPHAVPLFDFWRDPEGAYLVMPLLRGGSLSDALRRGPWNLAPTLRLLEQIGSAAGYAHRQGIVHRDIKPGNVLLDHEGNAYLSDFGVASRLTNELGAPLTTSLAYVAPEEMRGERLTERSDIFSLGVLAFHILTGVHPDGREPLTPVSTARAGIPAELDQVLQRATDDQPANRFEKVDDFLRAIRRAVGADVVAVAEVVQPIQSAPTRNPYKGLRAFLETDVIDFYGRDALIDEMMRSLAEHSLVAVVGPSGSGKSSVVRAGVVPALRAGGLPGSRGWLITDMFPGSYPFEELEAALLRIAVERPTSLIEELTADDRGLLRATKQILPADDSQLLLIIDQFEELFSNPPSEETRRLFLDSLRVVASDSRSRIRILVTMRADFFDRPLAYPEFAELIQAGFIPVIAPTGEGLAQAIAGPARRVGVDLEPGLVGRIRADVEGQPGSLPLLQYSLTELFDSRQNGMLTIAAYESTGGVVQALGRRAEDLYRELNPSGKEAARQLFLRLVTVDEDAGDTRRRVRQSELRTLAVDQVALDQVLQTFGSFRLLSYDRHPVTRGPTVEVAHEALLTEWQRLRGWIDSQRDELALHRRLSAAALDWAEADRDPSFLITGARLDQATKWIASGNLVPSAEEKNFVESSISRRREEELVVRRRRRRASFFLATALIAVTTLAAIAFGQSRRAQSEALQALVWGLTGDSAEVLDRDPELATLLALAAADISVQAGEEVGPETMTALGRATQTSRLERVLPDGSAHIAAGETLFASTALTSNVSIWDGSSSTPLRTLVGFSKVEALAFDPQGNLLAVAHGSPTSGDPFLIAVWDASSGQEIVRLSVPGRTMKLAWSPDGGLLAALSQGDRNEVTIWSTGQWRETSSFPADAANQIALLDSETVIVGRSFDRTISLHELDTGKATEAVEPLSIVPDHLAVDHQNRRIMVASNSTREVQAWDLGSRRMLWSTLPRAPEVAAPIAIAVSSKLGMAAVSGNEGTVQVLDLANGSQLMSLAPNNGNVLELGFASTQLRLISRSGGGEVRIWDVFPEGPRGATMSLGSAGAPCGVVLSPDGKEALLWTLDGSVIRLDTATGQIIRSIEEQRVDFFHPPAVSGDWQTMAWLDGNGDGWIRDLETFEPLAKLPLCASPKAFSPDGSLLVLEYDGPCVDGAFRSTVIEAATGREILSLGDRRIDSKAAAFNPDGVFEPGRYLAVSLDGVLEIYDMEDLRLVGSLERGSGLYSMAFDPSGRYLAVGHGARRASVIDMTNVERGMTVADSVIFEEAVAVSDVSAVSINADGVLAASTYGRVGLWDIHTRQLVTDPPTRIDTPAFAALTPDGSQLLYVDAGYVLRRWFLDPADLIEHARGRVTRSLSDTECMRYLGPGGCPPALAS